MQSDVQFYPGQQVILKSGGPIMTVHAVSPNGTSVACRWFDINLTPEACYEDFSTSVLRVLDIQGVGPTDKIALSEGAVVQLRSGGPLMTVQSVKESGDTRRCVCIWFDERNRKTTSSSITFHPHAVVEIDGY
ncbi:DUF2158 domain-containing protein [Aeromonas veronii]|uniref:DUF2158 domain-containing protein n=1 Tax=Aeromonas veronii TaxID=654 RepID=UPI003BA0EFF3